MYQFSQDSRINRAMTFLATLPSDLVTDIQSACNAKGATLQGDLSQASSGPRPYAILSRSVVKDDKFGHLLMGLNTVLLAGIGDQNKDKDFYAHIFEKAFGIDSIQAAKIADRVETYDVVGGTPSGRLPWYRTVGSRFWEWTKAGVNSLLGTDFNESQKWDIDVIYEFFSLGKAIEDLYTRAEFVKGAGIAAGMTGATLDMDSGKGDPVSAGRNNMVRLMAAVTPLMRPSLPDNVYGDLAPIVRAHRSRSAANLAHMCQKAGMIDRSGRPGIGDVQDPGMAAAIGSLLNGDLTPGMVLAGDPAIPKNRLGRALAELFGLSDLASVHHNTSNDIREDFGDPVADAYMAGDVNGMMAALNQFTGPIATTGDTGLDEAIIGDVISELKETGDYVHDPECKTMGGLFTRWRINAAIRRGKRRARKARRRYELQRAKDFSNNQFDQTYDQPGSGVTGYSNEAPAYDGAQEEQPANTFDYGYPGPGDGG